jgi:hypothetical protein
MPHPNKISQEKKDLLIKLRMENYKVFEIAHMTGTHPSTIAKIHTEARKNGVVFPDQVGQRKKPKKIKLKPFDANNNVFNPAHILPKQTPPPFQSVKTVEVTPNFYFTKNHWLFNPDL